MKPIVILHEGNNKSSLDNKLIKKLIEYLKLDEKDESKEFNKVKFYGMGVKSNFFNSDFVVYRELKQRIADYEVKQIFFIKLLNILFSTIFFIVDADSGHDGGLEKTKNKLETVIAELKIETISQFFIMRNPKTNEGYVESFILSTIPEEKMKCIHQFLECTGFNAKDGDKSTYERIYKSIAHPLSPYNFDHPHFDALKTKLENLFI